MVLFLCWFPTNRCELRSRSQEPGPETLELTLETGYRHSIGSHVTTLERICMMSKLYEPNCSGVENVDDDDEEEEEQTVSINNLSKLLFDGDH